MRLPVRQRAGMALVLMAVTIALMLAGTHGPAPILGSRQNAIAVATVGRNETKIRLLLEMPDILFTRLASHPTGGKNRDLARAPSTTNEWIAIDMDYVNNMYYVIDQTAQCIMAISASTNSTGMAGTCLYSGISRKASALAVDWLENSVYWTDAGYDSILKYQKNQNCDQEECTRSVIYTSLDTPTGLAVFPHRQLLFWTDSRKQTSNRGTLERSLLTGANRTLLFDSLSTPSALALDYNSGRLYWLAQTGDTAVVETSDLDGGDHYSALAMPDRHFVDLDIYKGLMLLVDQNEMVLYDIAANTSRQLWLGSCLGVCVFSQDSQPTEDNISRLTMYEDKDSLAEGFLITVSAEHGISFLSKTLFTSPAPNGAPSLILYRDAITALAVNVHKEVVYFFDRRQGAIESVGLEFLRPHMFSQAHARIVTIIPGKVSGLAVDWLTGVIYWTDSHFRRLACVTQDGVYVRTLASKDVAEPRRVVVHPFRGQIFWTDVDRQNPRIERINANGTHRVTIVSRGMLIDRPLSLTIDFKNNMLYWSDGPRICRTDLDGASTVPCTEPLNFPRTAVKSLDIAHDFIVWTDFDGGIHVADQESQQFWQHQSSMEISADTFFYTDVVYYHSSRQPAVDSACYQDNGGCEHFCLYAHETDQKCACATGYWVLRNGSCVSGFVDDHFLLVTDPVLGGIYQQYLYLPEYYVLPLTSVRNPGDVTFDSITKMVYWTDLHLQAVLRAHLNGSRQEVVYSNDDIVAETLCLFENLQLLYFIDTSRHMVIVISLRAMNFMVIMNSSDVIFNDLGVDFSSGHLYFTATKTENLSSSDERFSSSVGILGKCEIDGSNCSDVLTLAGKPGPLLVTGEGVFWLDIKAKTVNKYNFTDRLASVLFNLPECTSPSGLAHLNEQLYWTHSVRPVMFRAHLNGEGDIEEFGGEVLFKILRIDSYSSDNRRGFLSTEHTVLDPCTAEENPNVSVLCHPIKPLIEAVMVKRGFCIVPMIVNGQSVDLEEGSFVTSHYGLKFECYPGYELIHGPGLNHSTTRRFTSICFNGVWSTRPVCKWAMSYNISGSSERGYVVLTSTTDFVIPAGVTSVDVLAIGGGGGGMFACSARFRNVTQAGSGGNSTFGRYLMAEGGAGGRTHSGGRGGFGTVYFGGPGEISSLCLGGGSAGQTDPSDTCYLGSTSCPFCGTGGAPPACSICRSRVGGCSGPWSIHGQNQNANQFGGGASGWAGGGGGGGGGYSRRTVDVTPGEVIPVVVGLGGQLSVGMAGNGVVVVAWGDQIENVLPPPDAESRMACRSFTWATGSPLPPDSDFSEYMCNDSGQEFEP